MHGGFAPRLKRVSLADTSLLLTQGNTTLAVNQAFSFTWTGTHIYNNTVTFNSTSTFSSTTYFNSSTYFSSYTQFSSTVYFYTTPYFWNGSYNYSTWYNYGSMYMATWPTGAIPFVNESLYLTYDVDDFFRDYTNKRYGWGIGSGDTLLAKNHVVGLGLCSGTETACDTLMSSETCNAQSGCSWTSFGSCSSYDADEATCTATIGCVWDPGTSCTIYNADQTTCEATPGCTWNETISDCAGFNGNEMGCTATMGCTWNPSTCGSIMDAGTCNMTAGCSWASSDCHDFDASYIACVGTSGCSWDPDEADCADFNGDKTTCQATPGCTWNATDCSIYNSNQTTCQSTSGCTWNSSPCTDFNDNFGGCGANPGCSWSAGGFDCSTLDSTDQPTCEGNPGCTWNAGDNTCYGTCSGEYNTTCSGEFNTSCSGSYDPGTGVCNGLYNESCNGDNSFCSGMYVSASDCSGTFGVGCLEQNTCMGTADTCDSFSDSDEATCEAQAGCSWTQEPAGYFDKELTVTDNLIVGLPSYYTGKIDLYGTAGGYVRLTVADSLTSWTMRLPTAVGGSSYVLADDGSGNTYWFNILGTANTWGADQSVPDEAYSSAWNGSLEVPTKNAVYDQVQIVSSDSYIYAIIFG